MVSSSTSDADEPTDDAAAGRFAVPIETLEDRVRVRQEDQVENEAADVGDSSWAWDEAERQRRLAGGA